jgi:hypothetical protein
MQIKDHPILQRLKAIAKVPMSKVPVRDKTITAACRTHGGIEWASLKIKQDGSESAQQGTIPAGTESGSLSEALASDDLPGNFSEVLQGDIHVSLPSSELLIRVVEFPTVDSEEIRAMVEFQIDKVSPFPSDQMAISHEILKQEEETSLVLMAASKRSGIDAIGDIFQEKGVHIHSIDARTLGWMQLLKDEGHIKTEGCHVYIIDDSIDFTLAVMCDGIPLAFRAFHAHTDEMEVIEELCREISYTITALDSEHELPDPASVQCWIQEDMPDAFFSKLREKSGLTVEAHDLNTLPPLSEGILRRSRSPGQRMELIPREWIDFKKRKALIRRFSMVAGSIAAILVVVLLVFFGIYKTRDIKLNRVQAEADDIAPKAQEAFQNRKKLQALRVYMDRSDSSLECLREVTRMLPDDDIEFVSFNYKKNKAVTLRGTAGNDDIAYDYFEKLNNSKLFSRLKDQSVTTKVTKGIRRAVFSANLELKSEEGGK